MYRDLRVKILTHHGRGLDTNGLVAQRSALVIHAYYANVFSHQLHRLFSASPQPGKDYRMLKTPRGLRFYGARKPRSWAKTIAWARVHTPSLSKRLDT